MPSAGSITSGLPLSVENDRRAIVFYHPDVESIATEFTSRYPLDARLGHVSWGHFPDGWANVKFEHQDNIINRHVVFVMSAYKMDRFLEQICLLVALCRQFARSITIVIPYFGPATMERVVNEGELATAEPVLKLLSEPLPSTSGGAPALVLIDIHDIRERFYPTDKVTPRMLSASALILPIVREHGFTIVFPDEGAWKRFGNLTEGLPVITFVKRRDGDERELTLGSCYNVPTPSSGAASSGAGALGASLRYLIWDDLVHSGRTLIECSAALHREYGEDIEVSAFVTHAIFENEGHVRFLDKETTGISRFYVTDSIPEVAEKLSKYPDIFTVLDITSVISPFLLQRILPEGPPVHAGLATVFVSSSSPVKLRAVRQALPGHLVSEVPCASQVHEQPWGEEETLLGLRNRHRALRRQVFRDRVFSDKVVPDHVYLVSIENGIVPAPDGPLEDRAYLLLEEFRKGHHRLVDCAVTDGIVPDEHREDFTSEHATDPHLTFGHYIKKRDPSVDPADWTVLHGQSYLSRWEALRDTLASMTRSADEI